MNSRNYVFRETLTIVIGEAAGVALMLAVFALLGSFDHSVLLGGLTGGLLAAANFFIMALGADQAAKKAENQDVKGGQALIQLSYIGRLIGLFVILVICAKTGIFNLLALVIPLVFPRPILTISDIFKKKGGTKA